MISDAASIVGHQLGLAKIKLETELAPDMPRFNGNGNQIQQILMNLTLNAQQAMGGEPGKVKLSSRLLNTGMIEVRVADNGPGMSQEVKEKIFEPFFTTKPSGEGTGLGLSVSFKIIEDHKGTIRVESEPGEGATFVITLPALVEEESVADELRAAAG